MPPAKKKPVESERIAKLEYVVYEDHGPTLKQQQVQIDANAQTSLDIINNLKSIKRLFAGFCIGYTMNQIGVDKTLELLSKLIGN